MRPFSRRAVLFAAACFTASIGYSQVTVVSPTGDGGFETGTTFALNGWTTANQAAANREWYCGTGQSGYDGARAAFIGNNATTVGTNTSARTIHLYKSITLPIGATNIQVSFKYKQATSDNTYDYTLVSATTQTPVAGSDVASGLLTTMDPSGTEYATFTTVNTTIPNSMAGSTFNLVFTWHSDNVAPHAYGAVDDVSVTYTAAPACTGTPDAGTVSGYGPVCSTDNFTLALNNASIASGLTFQWQSSTDGVTFTNVLGATSPTLTTTETAGTYFRAIVACTASAQSDTTAPHYISYSATCYCAADATDTETIFEKISNVSVGTLNNSSTSFAGYENFLSLSTDLTKDEAHTITLSLVNDYDQDHAVVFIDYNQNGVFTDPGETVFTSAIDYGPYTGSFTIPSTALNGTTRMRVRLDDSSDTESNSTSCGTSGYGQVEDYTVNIVCPVIPAPTGVDGATCANTAASLSASSVFADASYTWYDLSSGGTSQGTGSSFTTPALSATTTYYVAASIPGCAAGPRTAVTASITAAPAPVVTAGGPLTFCQGNSVVLTTSSATGNTWSTGATTQSITVTTAGSYTVTETAGSCSGTSAPMVVTVNAAPTVNAGADQIICEGASVALTATGTGAFTWDNGVQQAIPFTPTTTTTYTVTADNGNCTATDMVTVTVSPAPTADAGADQTICEGTSIALTATGTGTFTWDNGVQQAVPFTPTATTTYTVTVDNGGCTTTDNVTVTVNPAPTANAGADQSICTGASVALTATGTGTFSWDNGVQQATPFSPTTTTTYTVTVDNGTCTATDAVTVTVNPLPTANAGADQSICAGASVVLTATGTGTFSWDNGVQQATPFTPATTTTYTVTVDNGTCTNTDAVTVTVNPVPTVNAGADQTICDGASISLTATGTGTFSWNNGVQQGVPFAPSATATYTVTVNNGSCTNTDNVTVTVNALPAAAASLSGTATLTASPAGQSYQWINCTTNAPVAGATSATFTATANGSYAVIVTNGSNCSATSSCVAVTTLGLEEAALEGIAFFPNPTTGKVTITMPESLEGTVAVYDAQGKLVAEAMSVANGSLIDLTAAQPGVYMIRLTTANGAAINRIVKQ